MKRLSTALILCLALALPSGAAETGPGALFESDGGTTLSGLMGSIRGHFTSLVETAYFTGAMIPLRKKDFEDIGEDAEAIARFAGEVRARFSRGKRFDHWAEDLQEHAEKVARAARRGELPEVNAEAGEMAEYCARCHIAFRWSSGGGN